jgi:hypothetical protein
MPPEINPHKEGTFRFPAGRHPELENAERAENRDVPFFMGHPLDGRLLKP